MASVAGQPGIARKGPGVNPHPLAAQNAALALVQSAAAHVGDGQPPHAAHAQVLVHDTGAPQLPPVSAGPVTPQSLAMVAGARGVLGKQKKPDGRSANRKGPPKDLHSRIEAAAARKKREERLEYCVKMCIAKGWGYRKAVSRRELKDYIDKKEMMSLKRRLARAKQLQASGEPLSAKERTDGRFLLCVDDENDIKSWLVMCNRVGMNVSITDFKKAVLKTLQARHQMESQEGYAEEKKVLSKNAHRVLEHNAVSSRFVDHFKTRHPEVSIGGWTKAEKHTSIPVTHNPIPDWQDHIAEHAQAMQLQPGPAPGV